MTIEELRALVQAARDASDVVWDGVILLEETTGTLKVLNDNASWTARCYNLALEQLNKQAPSLEDAKLLLRGARNHETQRGGAANAAGALTSLIIYEEAPYHGESFGSSFAAGVNVST